MNTFKHNGIEITLTKEGKFEFCLAGEYISAASLDAAKRRIDKAEKNPFKEFDAMAHHYSQWRKVRIVGINKPRGKWGAAGQHSFRDEKGNTHHAVIPMRQGLPELIAEHDAMEERHSKEYEVLRTKHNAETEAMRKKLQWLGAPEFLKQLEEAAKNG